MLKKGYIHNFIVTVFKRNLDRILKNALSRLDYLLLFNKKCFFVKLSFFSFSYIKNLRQISVAKNVGITIIHLHLELSSLIA